jgi:hypothetical protein
MATMVVRLETDQRKREHLMSTALIAFLNVFFIAFVLVTIVGLCARSIVSDRTSRASTAGRRARPRAAIGTRSRDTAPARRRGSRALDLGA